MTESAAAAPHPPGFQIVQVVREFGRDGAHPLGYQLQRRWEAAGVPSTVLAGTLGDETAPGERLRVRLALPERIGRLIPTRGAWRRLGRAALVPSFALAAAGSLQWATRRGGWADGAVILSHGDMAAADVVVLQATGARLPKRQDRSRRAALDPRQIWDRGRSRLVGGPPRRFVAVSRQAANELVQRHGVPRERVAVIPNGTDLQRFTPQGVRAGLREQFPIPPAAPLLLFVGDAFHRQGLACLVAALTRPGCADVHAVAVGAGDTAAYASLAEACGVGDRMHFTGPRQDRAEIYRDADGLVCPGGLEAAPLDCLDAMACGVPLFAAPIGAVADYLQDGENGLTIERDGAAIAVRLGPVLADRAALARLSAGARATAGGLDWSVVAKRHLDLLLEVWAEKRAANDSDPA